MDAGRDRRTDTPGGRAGGYAAFHVLQSTGFLGVSSDVAHTQPLVSIRVAIVQMQTLRSVTFGGALHDVCSGAGPGLPIRGAFGSLGPTRGRGGAERQELLPLRVLTPTFCVTTVCTFKSLRPSTALAGHQRGCIFPDAHDATPPKQTPSFSPPDSHPGISSEPAPCYLYPLERPKNVAKLT